MRNGRMPARSTMNTPLPWRGSTMPSFFSREMASRITVRLTPNSCASTASVGSLPVAAKLPFSINFCNCCATVSDSARGGIFSNIRLDEARKCTGSSYKFRERRGPGNNPQSGLLRKRLVDERERVADFGDIAGAHEARDFLATEHEDERRPKLHAKRAAERAAA